MRRLALMALLALAGSAAAQTPSSLGEMARREPARIRDSALAEVRRALARPAGAARPRQSARALAAAIEAAWDDRFFAARVDWLLALDAAAGRRFLSADSLRRLGNAALFEEGPAVARRHWIAATGYLASIGDSGGMIQLAGNIGAGLYEEARLDSAAIVLERARRAALLQGDRRTAGNASTILASIALERGQPRAALEFARHARLLHEQAGDFAGAAADRHTTGQIAERLGDEAGAERDYRAALALSEQVPASARAADYLLSLGALAQRRGDASEARLLIGQAIDRYHAAGERRNEALALLYLGASEAAAFAPAALRHYAEAARLFAAADDPSGEADSRRLLASAHASRGAVDRALEEISQAARLADRLDPPAPALAAAIATVRGDIELLLNRTGDARSNYEAALRWADRAGDGPARAAASQGLALLELRKGRSDLAVRMLEPVARLQHGGREGAWSRLLLGSSRAALGDTSRARADLEAAVADYRRLGDRTGLALSLGELAALHTSAGRPFAALRLLSAARRETGGNPSLDWWLHLLSGRAHQAGGSLAAASLAYDTAMAMVDRLAAGVRLDDRRALLLEDKWEPFAAAAALAAGRGEGGHALRLSERLRARYLLDLMARSPRPARMETGLRAEERRLRRRVMELSAAVTPEHEGRRGGGDTPLSESSEALLAAQAQYRRLLDDIAAREPALLAELRSDVSEPADIQRALGESDLLLEYLLTDRALWIFAVTRDGVRQFEVAVGRAALRTQVDFARWTMQERLGEPELWRGALAGLDRALIEPVRAAGLLAGRTRLIIVPHLELHYLPFEALLADGRYLVEAHDVIYTPSASTWLRGRRGGGEGVLALAPLDATLPGTAAEVRAIAETWGGTAQVHLGRAATERRLRSASGFRIVHLATRGVLDRRQPDLSFVQLQPEPGDDGRLSVREVLALRLDTDLLMLTACESALGAGAVADVPNGDDWISLVRAFLHAGAREVLATLWAVDDRRTAIIAADFHRRVAQGDNYAAALAQAKRAAIASADHAAPWYWSGLVLTGTKRAE